MNNHWRSNQGGSLLHPAILFAGLFFFLLLLHLPLLRLPYFWDEAGYYIPAAHDLLLTASWIPHSTPSNAHPPLVMAYLALWWKICGFSVLVTRTAMLAVAAFSLTGLFLLASSIANFEVAVASTLCTAIYPVFFSQSSLAHLDMAAAGFTFWALLAYVESRQVATGAWFSLAALSKETAILAPIALLVWELLRPHLKNIEEDSDAQKHQAEGGFQKIKWTLCMPLLPLAVWYEYHYQQMGYVFGNPEFFRYNVRDTLSWVRILFALLLRLWQLGGYLSLYILTVAAAFAMWRPALRDRGVARQRIILPTQFALLTIILTYLVSLAVVGGAVLARYLLPVVPLVIIVCVSTIRRRVLWWKGVIAIVVISFGASLFINPPYGFSIEDNLAYRDYILLHQGAEHFLEAKYGNGSVMTAWPASDELSRTYLGFVTHPMKVIRIEDFTIEQLSSARQSTYDVAFLFSTKYQPNNSFLARVGFWQQIKTRYFGYHYDLPPGPASEVLRGRLVYEDQRGGQWVAVMERSRID